MNRKEYEQKSWTHIKRKLPPDTRDFLLAWNYALEEPFVQQGFILHEHAKRLLINSNSYTTFTTDRLFSHWRRVIGPK